MMMKTSKMFLLKATFILITFTATLNSCDKANDIIEPNRSAVYESEVQDFENPDSIFITNLGKECDLSLRACDDKPCMAIGNSGG